MYLDDEDKDGILFPFFLHVMWGDGSPDAIHRNAAIPPAFTLIFCGASRITGGSIKEKYFTS